MISFGVMLKHKKDGPAWTILTEKNMSAKANIKNNFSSMPQLLSNSVKHTLACLINGGHLIISGFFSNPPDLIKTILIY